MLPTSNGLPLLVRDETLYSMGFFLCHMPHIPQTSHAIEPTAVAMWL